MSESINPSLLVAPGQGSQRPNLNKLADSVVEVKETYELADSIAIELFGNEKICGKSVSEHSETTTSDKLAANTAITQPLIVATSIGLIKYLRSREEFTTAYGHSLGEISALFAAGSLEEHEALRLAMLRGYYSRQAAQQKPGAMVALFNLPSEIKERLQSAAHDEEEVTISTDNSPDQLTISGPKEKAIKFAENIRDQYQKVKGLSKEERRQLPNAVVMKIEGAFHHALMKPAQREFRKALDAANITIPTQMLWFSNHSHTYEASPGVIREHLENQMVHPVHFWHDIGKLIADGHVRVVESGAGSVLTDGLRDQQAKKRLAGNIVIVAAEKDMLPERFDTLQTA